MNKLISIFVLVTISLSSCTSIPLRVNSEFIETEIPDVETTDILETQLQAAFFAVHIETSDHDISGASVADEWVMLSSLVETANQYGYKLTLEFQPQWAEYALNNPDKRQEVLQWEAQGHEIAFHHHGLSHPAWDGYSNQSAAESRPQYRGTNEDGLNLVRQLSSTGQVFTAGMTDENLDWLPELKYATGEMGKSGGGLISSPEQVKIKGIDVIQLDNRGYALDRGPVVSLEEIESSLLEGKRGEVLGLVSHPYDYWERKEDFIQLFDLLERYGVHLQSVSEILSVFEQNTEVGGDTSQPLGYMTFAVNVHDWVHIDESAETLLALVNLFEKYDVRGDFYFTAEVTRALFEKHPEVIERFRESRMTISYHVRPPHPLYAGFDERLAGLSEDELYQVLLDYETYAFDLTTGDLDRSRPGGYSYVAQIFGRNPVVASAPNPDPRIKSVAQRVYRDLGAQMTVLYHESGTSMEQPFQSVNGLLVRPSDFSVTRVTSIDGSQNFWWNYMGSSEARRYHPTIILQDLFKEWHQSNPSRPPFITSLIHENNFYRRGPEAWTGFYYTIEKGKKGEPLSPPFDLQGRDYSSPRPESEQAAILAAYEELVAYAAEHLVVVTSEDIVNMAGH